MLQVDSKTPHVIYAEVLEDQAMVQFNECLEMEGCVQGALMADSHTGYVAPIGSVLKFENKVSPALIGYDIGCGLISTELDVKAEDLDLEKLRDGVVGAVPIGFNRHKTARDYEYASEDASKELTKAMNATGKFQLGTLGGGNHFIELGTNDRTGNLHIIIHSGSRGLGHKVATHYMKEAAKQSIDISELIAQFRAIPKNIEWLDHIKSLKASPKTDTIQDAYTAAQEAFVAKEIKKLLEGKIEGNYSLGIHTPEGQQFMIDQHIALDYAIANRRAMADAIIKEIEAQLSRDVNIVNLINKNHNHGVFEDGYIVHRKGATQAGKGEMGVIPGNMRDGCFIVEGKGNPTSMSSSSHGAGRVLSRTKAKALLSVDKFHDDMVGVVTNHTDATLDEAPDAYKDIFEVMALQEDLVSIVAHVTPVLNIKG